MNKSIKRNDPDRIQRYTLRKYSFGVVSALIASFFIGNASVSAEEVVATRDQGIINAQDFASPPPS